MPEQEDPQLDAGEDDETKPQESPSALDQAASLLHDMTGCSLDDARRFVTLLGPANKNG